MRTDKMHPLPWEHKTDGKKMSAVVDAEGKVVCGSLIMQQENHTKMRQTHAFIVKTANSNSKLLEACKGMMTVLETLDFSSMSSGSVDYDTIPWEEWEEAIGEKNE